MREIASPLSGPFTTFGQTPIDIYKVGAYRPELAYSFYNEYYRRGRQPVNFLDAITHTRNGNATMVDSDGVLKWAPHNLLTHSEDFSNAAWTKTNTTVTANAAVAPDGTQTADEISHTSTSSSFLQTTSQVSGAAYKFGIFIKSVDHQWVRIVHDGSSVWVDTTNIVVGTDNMDEPTSVLELTDGWLYIVVSNAYNGASSNVSILLASADNSTTETSGTSAYIWGAHLYRSDLGGMVDNPDRGDSYVPTTSSAVYLPRRGHHVYNGSQWVNKGLLHESEARTNLITDSEDLTLWGKGGVNVVGKTLTEDGSSGEHRVQTTITTVASSTYTVWTIVERGSGARDCRLIAFQSTSPFTNLGSVTVDLDDGSVLSGSGTVFPWGGDAYLVSITGVAPTTSTAVRLQISDGTTYSYAGDGSSSLSFTAVQAEAGSTPSSYIPTNNGATVTRPAESITIPAANLPWPNPVYVTNEELVTNGTFDTDTTGWTANDATLSVASGNLRLTSSGDYGRAFQGVSVQAGKVYEVTCSVDFISGTNSASSFGFSSDGVSGGGAPIGNESVINGSGTHSLIWVAPATATYYLRVQSNSASTDEVFDFDNISVKEINPLALSIQMSGEMTYADENLYNTVLPYNWTFATGTSIDVAISTNSTDTGGVYFRQSNASVYDEVSAQNKYTLGVNVPFNIASRHGSTFINGAVGGTSLTENTTPTVLPDLSATDLQLGYDMMGTISLFRIWGSDIGDDGISEAST